MRACAFDAFPFLAVLVCGIRYLREKIQILRKKIEKNRFSDFKKYCGVTRRERPKGTKDKSSRFERLKEVGDSRVTIFQYHGIYHFIFLGENSTPIVLTTVGLKTKGNIISQAQRGIPIILENGFIPKYHTI